MTKKNYIAPEMAVCNVETQAFIAASKLDKDISSETPQTITFKEGTSDDFGSRRYDIWEDEEEY